MAGAIKKKFDFMELMGTFQSDTASYVTPNAKWKIDAQLVTDGETGEVSIMGNIFKYDRRWRHWLVWTESEWDPAGGVVVGRDDILKVKATPNYVLTAVTVIVHIMRAKRRAREG